MTSHATAAIERGKKEILEDVASGRVPKPASFSDLHDHVDANEYGGLCDEPHPYGLQGEEWHQWGIDVQDALDEWIKGGMPT